MKHIKFTGVKNVEKGIDVEANENVIVMLPANNETAFKNGTLPVHTDIYFSNPFLEKSRIGSKVWMSDIHKILQRQSDEMRFLLKQLDTNRKLILAAEKLPLTTYLIGDIAITNLAEEQKTLKVTVSYVTEDGMFLPQKQRSVSFTNDPVDNNANIQQFVMSIMMGTLDNWKPVAKAQPAQTTPEKPEDDGRQYANIEEDQINES